MRRAWVIAALLAGLVGVGLGVATVSRRGDERQFQEELALAGRELVTGRLASAKSRLTRLDSAWPGRPEVAYSLGRAEKARGRYPEALAAWERVPFEASIGPRAAVDRGNLLVNLGRHTPAESLLRRAVGDEGPIGREVRRAIARLYRLEGRMSEVRRWIEADWERDDNLAAILQEHWGLDHDGFPIDGVRKALDVADQDDDRVWLGRANLASRMGRYDEAADWLARCQARRPDDEAVWRGWLDWAMAVRDPRRARQAVDHLPASGFDAPEVLAIRAWFAATRGDTAAEREALEQIASTSPHRGAAIERLVELAAADGKADRVNELRRRKDEHDQALERYRRGMIEPDPVGRALELAGLAQTLGRRFEARGWATLAARDRSKAAPAFLSELDRTEPSHPAEGRRLVALLDLPGRDPAAPTPAPGAGAGPSGAVEIADDAVPAGLRFTFDNGLSFGRQLPESMSGGVGVLDYDGDGLLDVYALQGGPFPPDPTKAGDGDRLFRNRGDGTFEDATGRSGIAGFPRGYGHGIATGDFDNDGHTDLFLTRWRSYALYRNRGDGTFEDATARAGLGGDRDWPTSAAWADLDDDGDLDLYVCHYLAWDAANPRACFDAKAGVNKYCDPRTFHALPDHVFRNDGGRFVDVTAESGIVDRDGRGLGVVAADLDGDARLDLFVANDTSANRLYRNLGGFRFEEVGHDSGVASSASGGYLAGMGIGCGDLDGDGLIDLAVTNFYHESTTYYHNLGGGLFTDQTEAIGLAGSSRHLLGFGAAFLDSNNDGRLDLMTVNGHVNDSRPYFPFAMPAKLWLGVAGGRVVEARVGGPFDEPRVGRGLAVGDLDNDGRLDALAVGLNQPLAYFHNRTSGGHFLTLRLEGTASNRDGVGARVTVVGGGRRQFAQRFGGGSYLSAGDPRLHFGLGTATVADSVEVRWPSGRVDLHPRLAADRGYLLREGAPAATPMAGFARP